MEKCSHDNCWILEEIQGIPQSCFACAIEVLESSEKPNVNKVHIIKEILKNLTNPSSCVVILQQNGIAVKHLSEILVSSAYQIGDSEIISIIDDIFLIILRCLGDEVGSFISSLIISKCYHVTGYNFLQPLLRLLSGLLKNCESACDSVLLKDNVFPRYLSSTMEYPDNILKQTILQLFFLGINLRMQNAERLSTPVFIKDLYRELPMQILSIISTNDQSSTLLSCVDIITSTSVAEDFLSWICSSSSSDHNATMEMENAVLNLLTGLKRILLKRDNQLTLKVVHCLLGLLGRHPDPVLHSLLNADLAEFLYDILRSTTSPDLISSIYCCILLLAESQAFYTNCHATYGFESILRSLQTILPMSHSTLCAQGILLLSTILKQQTESSRVSILCTLSLLDRTIEIIKDGLESKHPDVIIAACTATNTLISHFPADLPVIEVTKLVEHMSDRLTSYISLLNGKNNADIDGADGDIDLCEIGPTSTEDNANIRKSTIRKLYTDVWNILRSSVDLALKILPSLSDFTKSNDDDPFVADAHKLVDTLMDKITNHWISSTTKTLDALTSPSLIHSMLLTLSIVCQHSDSGTFLQKLMRGILIRLALKVKSKFHDDPRHSDLIKVCVDFLTELTYAGLRAALGSNFSDQLKSHLSIGFAELQGKVSSYLKVLEEICSSVRRDDSILSMQCTVVAFLFNSFWYSRGDMTTISELSSALETYLILNESFTYFPSVILQQMLFLHAVCYADLTVTPTLHLSFITAAIECDVAYIRHPVFISYVLRLPSTEHQVIQVQGRTVKRWINETMEHAGESKVEEKLLIELCKCHENAGKVLLRTLLTSENETKLTEILLKIVCSNYAHHAKHKDEGAASVFCEEVARNLAEYAYNILARSTVEPPILHTLLHLLLLVTQHSQDSQSVEMHSFLLRVLKLLLDSLSKNKNLDRTTVVSSMQLIKAILISSTPYKQRATSGKWRTFSNHKI